MEQTLDLCRWTYNKTLEIRKNAWENEGKSLSKYETNNLLPEWKADKPELKDVFSQVLQNVRPGRNLDTQDLEAEVDTILLPIRKKGLRSILGNYIFQKSEISRSIFIGP